MTDPSEARSRELDSQSRDPGPPRRAKPRNWTLAAVAAVLTVVFYVLHNELLPFIIAASVAFVFEPLIKRVQPHVGNHRWIPVTVLFLLLLAFLAAFSYWIGTVASSQFQALSKDGPRMVQEMLKQVVGPNGISLFGKTYTADGLYQAAAQHAGSLLTPTAVETAAGLGIGAILGGFLTLVLIPYFLASGPRIARGLIWLVPPERRPSVERTLPEVVPVLRRYIVGVGVVVIFTATAAWLGFGLLFKLPNAILLSLAVGLLEIIPALGPATSMVLVALSATQEHSVGTVVFLMLYAIFLRLVIDNGVGPIVLGRSARLHPVAVMFGFVCGAALLGLVGLLLAVPAAACLVVVLDSYYAEPVAEPEARP